jgi:hypothetical protein
MMQHGDSGQMPGESGTDPTGLRQCLRDWITRDAIQHNT